MPKINTYAIDGTVTNNDKVIGTDNATGETRNYLVSDIVALASGGGGSSTFLDLTDTPSTYSGSGGYFAVVNAGATAIEFTQNPAATYIDLGYIAFDTAISPEPSNIGNMWWSADFETPYIQLDAGFKMRVGQDHVFRCKADTGVNIVAGDVVKFVNATGDTPIVGLADGSSDEPYTLVGVAVEDISSEEFGFVAQFGSLSMDTATPGWTLGQLLYVDPSSPGKLTNSLPAPPNWTFPIAAVTRVGAGSSGRIIVRAIPGLHLHDIIDVRISGIADKDILQYDTGTGVWSNKPISAFVATGDLTESTSSVLTITGGTGSVIGSGTTIEVGQATTSTNGYLSSTDWNTFNNKLSNVVEDTTPQLGGQLDANTNSITNAGLFQGDQFQSTLNTLTAGTIIWDTSIGVYAELTLNTNSILAIANLGVGAPAVLKVTQSGGGNNITSYTVSGGSVKWSGGTAPTISPTSGRVDIITFVSDGTDIYASIVQNFS